MGYINIYRLKDPISRSYYLYLSNIYIINISKNIIYNYGNYTIFFINVYPIVNAYSLTVLLGSTWMNIPTVHSFSPWLARWCHQGTAPGGTAVLTWTPTAQQSHG